LKNYTEESDSLSYNIVLYTALYTIANWGKVGGLVLDSLYFLVIFSKILI